MYIKLNGDGHHTLVSSKKKITSQKATSSAEHMRTGTEFPALKGATISLVKSGPEQLLSGTDFVKEKRPFAS